MTSNTPLPGSMPGNLPENAPQPADFSPLAQARLLLRTTRAGALGTLDRHTGHPVTTLVNVATDTDGAPLILVSGLSSHTANLRADGRASVLLASSGKGDPLAHPRLTVLGRMVPSDDPRIRQRFLARHPKSALYADFPDFTFWRMEVAAAHLNGGFARAGDMAGSELLLDVTSAEDLIAAEADILAHMNSDHAETVGLYATALLGSAKGKWRLVGLDPEGCDLAHGEVTARLLFDAPVSDAAGARTAFIALAARAKAPR